MKPAIWMVLVSVFVFTQITFAAGGIDPSFNASVTDGLGYVSHTLTQPDGKILAFGGFQKANAARFGNIVRFNPDGTLDATFNGAGTGADGFISSAALQADGKIIIGGNFNYFNGQLRIHLARLNANGSLDPTFNPTETFHPNYTIHDIVIQPDGKILISNSNLAGFQSSSNYVMRFNSDGTTDATFQNNLSYNGNIKSIVYLPTDKILVGGGFTTVGGVTKPFLARLNLDGSLDNSFSPAVSGSGFHKILIQPDGKILLAGEFLSRGVRRLNADGSAESAAPKPEAAAVVVEAGYDVALQPNGKVLVAYGFGGSGNVTDYTVIRLNADLTLDDTFSEPVPDRFPINDINLLSNGKFITGGNFVALNLTMRRYLAQMNADGTLDTDFNPALTSIGRITVVKRQPDGKILVGGIFEYVGDERRTNIARLNADGSLDNTFNPSPDLFDYIANFVNDIELQADGKILVGRIRFSGATVQRNDLGSGISQGAVIRLNTNGSLDETFETITTHVVQGVAVSSDNKILIGGFLENLQIPPFGMEGFRKLLPNGNLDMGFNPLQPPAGSVNDILIQPDGKVLIGGSFTNVGGGERLGTARYNADGTLDNSYISNIRTVRTMALASDGKIYIGGSFGITLPEPNMNLARLNANGSFDGGFSAMATGAVRDLLVQPNGKLIIGGDFTSYNNTQTNRVARVNTNGEIDPTFDVGSGADGNVYALERQPDGKILVGGQFFNFNNREKMSLVRLQNPASVTAFDFDGDLRSDISIFRPSVGEWWYLRSSDGQNRAFQFGNSADRLTPADFTGDGKTDIAIWRPSVGEWYILRSDDNSFYAFPFGTTGDIPSVGDFDEDGQADATVFRPSTGTWYVNRSSKGALIRQFGINGDAPVPADYDGDGTCDIAIYRPSLGEWWIERSTAGLIAYQFGNGADKPVPGDYTGDGKTDAAFFRSLTGEWFVLRSENYSYYSFPFGTGGDVPAPGDYDGDGKFDATVFRPSSSTWYVQRSTAGTLIQPFGAAGDRPVPNAFVP